MRCGPTPFRWCSRNRTISDKPALQVAKETGAAYGGVLYVDSLSEADGPVPTYLDLLNVTVDTIAKGFGK
jgi:manganese/iron transport system substrate-binding protein